MTDIWPYLLVFTRISVFLAISPVFFPTGSPRLVKALCCIGFTLAMAPLAHLAAPLPAFEGGKIVLLAREAFIGGIIGSAVHLPFAALRGAGSIMDMQSGMSMAHMMDPSSGQSESALSSFIGMLGMMIFLSLDGHLWVLRGLAESFTRLPLAGAWPSLNGIGAWINLTGNILTTTVQVSAPIVALLLLTEFSLGIISRILPQLNLLILGQPVRFAVGIGSAALLVGFFEPIAGRVFTQFFGDWAAMIMKL